MWAAVGGGLEALRHTLGSIEGNVGSFWRHLEGVLEAIEDVLTAMLSKDGAKNAQESENIENHSEIYDLGSSRTVSWRHLGSSWGRLGGLWRRLGGSWRRLGGSLKRSGGP